MRYLLSHSALRSCALLATLVVAACNSYDDSLLSAPTLSMSRHECMDRKEACNGLDDDCDGIIDEDASAACNLDHARTHCAAGTCVLDACDEGFLSCDGAADNGCEHELAACGGCDKECNAVGVPHAGEPAPAVRMDAEAPSQPDDADAGAGAGDDDAGTAQCSEERCDGVDNDCDGRTDEGGMCGCAAGAPTGLGEECDRCACQRCGSALNHCLVSGNAEWDTSCRALMQCVGKSTLEGRCTEDADCGSACASQWYGAGWRPNRSCDLEALSMACVAFVMIQETCYQTKCDKACKH